MRGDEVWDTRARWALYGRWCVHRTGREGASVDRDAGDEGAWWELVTLLFWLLFLMKREAYSSTEDDEGEEGLEI